LETGLLIPSGTFSGIVVLIALLADAGLIAVRKML